MGTLEWGATSLTPLPWDFPSSTDWDISFADHPMESDDPEKGEDRTRLISKRLT